MNDIELIISRLKYHFGVKKDTELAKKLDIPYRTFNTWKTRKEIPSSRLSDIAVRENLSLDWIISGKGLGSFRAFTREDNVTAENIKVKNGVYVGGNNKGDIKNGHKQDINSDMEEFLELFKKYGNETLLEKFKNELLKIKDIMDG